MTESEHCVAELPYLTAGLPGIGGQIKMKPEDFYVEEIPLYPPSGEGQHIYLQFEKVGLTTLAAIKRIGQSLGIRRKQIGHAGLKDAHAVTRQTISIDGVSPERVAALNLNGIRVISISKHRNKLKIGHLAGNKFVIRVREVERDSLSQMRAILDHLERYGVPNYYGEQRFGLRRNSHQLGLALMKGTPTTFLAILLGQPAANEMKQAQLARAAFDTGNAQEALRLWPASMRTEFLVLKKLVDTGDEEAAIRALDHQLKRLFVSAYQSYLFNLLLVQRLPTLGRLEIGDIAFIHRNGAAFVVEAAEAEQPRADRFEISPAGPLFGKKYLPAQGEPGDREQALLRQEGVSLEDFGVPSVNLDGGRRPYRIPLADIDFWWDDGAMISFVLPAGGYATMALREIMKEGHAENTKSHLK